MVYGLFDTQTNLWMGNDDGPKIFSSDDVINGDRLGDDGALLMARIAAQVTDVRLGQDPGRTRALPYGGDATRVHDEVTPTMTTRAALRHIMRGGL